MTQYTKVCWRNTIQQLHLSNSILWHFECNDLTHYVEYVLDGVTKLRRVSEEVYQAILAEVNDDFLN